MGAVSIGRCKCECYINYVACDYPTHNTQISQSEIRSERPRSQRSNRFMDQSQHSQKSKNNQRKPSPGDSTERMTKLSSIRKATSRSPSEKDQYLLSEYCNITTDESKADQRPSSNRSIKRIRTPKRNKYIFGEQDLFQSLQDQPSQKIEPTNQAKIEETKRQTLVSIEQDLSIKANARNSVQSSSVEGQLPPKQTSSVKTLNEVKEVLQEQVGDISVNKSVEKAGVLKKPNDSSFRSNNQKQQQSNRVRWNLPQSHYIRERAKQQHFY